MLLTALINKLHKCDRKSQFVYDLFYAVHKKLAEVHEYIKNLKNEFFFDTLNLSIPSYEKLMKLTPFADATKEERQSAIWARWLANGKNTIKLIQDICNTWENGEIDASFVEGKIKLQFIGSYGIPSQSALSALVKQIEDIIPAHIGFFWQYKFLLKKEIHNVLTKSEMQQLSKNKYCEVKTNETN